MEQYETVGNSLVNTKCLQGGGVDWQRFGVYMIINSDDCCQPVEVERFDGVRAPVGFLDPLVGSSVADRINNTQAIPEDRARVPVWVPA